MTTIIEHDEDAPRYQITPSGVELVPVPQTRSPFGTDDPVAIVQRVTAVATPLADFIKQRGMSTRISGREYVLAEGWSFMGAMLGVSPIATRVSELRDGDGFLVGFEAHVELRMRDGSLVGGAVAECSRSETSWAKRDDFALKSMAQTRATGKAYRLAFGFVMKAAGYEATPAEEMGATDLPSRDVDDDRTVRPMQARRPVAGSVDAPGEQHFDNGGQLLTSALNYLHMNKAEVLIVLGVDTIAEVSDYSAAWDKLVAQTGAQ